MSILWDEACAIPDAIEATLRQREGFDHVLEELDHPRVRRVVATGNGAAYYAAMTLWLASLWTPGARQVVAVPAGVVSSRRFEWQEGDLLLAVSSSGEFRDVVTAIGQAPRAVAVTATRDSTVAKRASSAAVVQVLSQRSATHTQAYCGTVAALLALWAEQTGDRELASHLDRSAAMLERAFKVAEAWTSLEMSRLSHLPPAAVAFGSGAGWAAALETALLLKEVAGIPAEGVETREGATSSMYALRKGHLVLSIGAADDPLLSEAAEVCESAGASVIRLPSGEIEDERLLPLLSFPTSMAVAIALGTRAGLDVDAPAWLHAYAKTARGLPVGLEAAS